MKTAGRGCVDPLGVPSCEAIVTVGRVAIAAVAVMSSSWFNDRIQIRRGEVDLWEPKYASII